MESKIQQTASREIKKYLISVVRNDWEWPPPEASATSAPPSEVASHALKERKPVAYRERYYGSTDESNGDDDEDEESGQSEAEEGEKAFKFEDPDSIGGMMEKRIAKRKRKRKAKLEEEMKWNDGMRCFVERRNAWTAARSREDERPAQPEVDEAKDDRTDSQDVTMQPPSTETDEQKDTKGTTNGETNDEADVKLPDDDPLLPIPPPLIEPSNPIRAAITPRAYPDIYSKIVTSSRTPTTPINLIDMTRALVQGWKENGEWPPRANAIEPPIAGRRTKTHQNGRDPALAEAMGLHAWEEAPHGISLGEGILANHPHFKKGVEGVKKVLRLSGSHSHQSTHDAHHVGLEGGE